jgi:nitrite reductase (NADH) large subunit
MLYFAGGGRLAVDMVVVAAGIRPRSELAARAGLRLDDRGGIVIDDALQTSDPRIHAIGECASHRSGTHGLVAPGYAMADALAARLSSGSGIFAGEQAATRLKLLEIDVAAAGEVLDGAASASFEQGPSYRRIRISGGPIATALGGGRLEGALGVGPWPDFVRIQDAVRPGRRLASPAPARCGENGRPPRWSLIGRRRRSCAPACG